MTTTIPTPDAYASATRSEKSIMRSNAMREMMAAVGRMDMDTATAWRNAMESWKSNTRSVTVRDYDGAIANRIATLHAAIVALSDGIVRPTDLPTEIELSFESVGSADMASAVRIASEPLFRATKSDMTGSIESVMDHMTTGSFYTMTEIAHMVEKYAPAYAGRRASVGAVTNAVRNGIDGLTFGHNGTANGATRES